MKKYGKVSYGVVSQDPSRMVYEVAGKKIVFPVPNAEGRIALQIPCFGVDGYAEQSYINSETWCQALSSSKNFSPVEMDEEEYPTSLEEAQSICYEVAKVFESYSEIVDDCKSLISKIESFWDDYDSQLANRGSDIDALVAICGQFPVTILSSNMSGVEATKNYVDADEFNDLHWILDEDAADIAYCLSAAFSTAEDFYARLEDSGSKED